jgi:tRNA (guanine37-N1)-methyltransferase
MRFDILTLFPGYFDSPLSQSILSRAIERGVIEVKVHNIRDWALDSHRTTDDAPYGGGCGMVMKPEPVVAAIEAVRNESIVVLLSPQGEVFDQRRAVEFSKLKRIALVCGRYEGVDERVRRFVDMEVSIGDYVLSGGEPAALSVIDSTARLVEGVVGDRESLKVESFAEGLLEYPHYTRPEEFMGMRVPEVLLTGDHGAIERWRRRERIRRTLERRPELLAHAELSEEDKEFIKELTRKKRYSNL